MVDPTQPGRPSRPDSKQAAELKALRLRFPELTEAINMHLEFLELERRILSRVPLPFLEVSADIVTRHASEGRPLLHFENIPFDLTDLRLMVRQTTDVMRRFGTLDAEDAKDVQSLGRDMQLLTVARAWFRSTVLRRAGSAPAGHDTGGDVEVPDAFAQVMAQAMRPFLSRCAEVLQPRPELALWPHSYCAVCGGEPDFSVITPQAERHLICSRCTLRWNFEPLTCPYCGNGDRGRITSFATPDGIYRVYGCDVCRRYLKAYDARRGSRPVMPVVDSVATLPLDAAAMQRGYIG